MKSYSLATLLLLTTVVALILSQFVMWQRLQKAHKETRILAANYGHINAEDPNKTYVFRFINSDYGWDGDKTSESFRVFVPEGKEYMVHLTDWPGNQWPVTKDLEPTVSRPLKTYSSLAVVSCGMKRAANSLRIVVGTESELLFNHTPNNWSGSWTSTSSSWPDIEPSKATSFDPEKRIRLIYWFASNANKDGFVLWLEPRDQWLERNKAETSASEQ